MLKYLSTCPLDSKSGKRANKFNIVKYAEEYRAVTKTIHRKPGRLMHKSMFLGWAQTWDNPKGACKSVAEAEAQWQEYESLAHLKELISDQKGPISEPLRIRIPLSDELHFEDSFEHSKRQEIQHQKEQKSVKEGDILAGRRALLRDHERGIGNSTDDFGAVAQAMVSNSAHGSTSGEQGPHISAYQGSGVFVPDVAHLQDSMAAEKQEKAEAREAKKKGKAANAEEAAEEKEDEDDATERAAQKGKPNKPAAKFHAFVCSDWLLAIPHVMHSECSHA